MKNPALFLAASATLTIIAILLTIPTATAAEANSSALRVRNQIFDGGGQPANSSGYRTFDSITCLAGIANTTNTFACLGYVCFTLEQLGGVQTTVTFMLNFNISGVANDVASVDGKTFGFYRPLELNKFFTCVQDAGIASTPTFGIVSSGQQLNYIELQNSSSSFVLRVSQFQQDNKFLVPVTTGGCANIGNKLPLNSLTPFVPTGEVIDAVEMFLSYPFTDIVGNYEKSGRLTLVLDKNDTNQIVADVI